MLRACLLQVPDRLPAPGSGSAVPISQACGLPAPGLQANKPWRLTLLFFRKRGPDAFCRIMRTWLRVLQTLARAFKNGGAASLYSRKGSVPICWTSSQALSVSSFAEGLELPATSSIQPAADNVAAWQNVDRFSNSRKCLCTNHAPN